MLDALAYQIGLCFVNFLYQQVKQLCAIHVLLAGCLTYPEEILFVREFLSGFDCHLAVEWPFHADPAFVLLELTGLA